MGEPIVKTWLTEGVDDPPISVVQVAPSSGCCWDTEHGTAAVGAKMLIGVAIGKRQDDPIEGDLTFQAPFILAALLPPTAEVSRNWHVTKTAAGHEIGQRGERHLAHNEPVLHSCGFCSGLVARG
jgi:hypothetical protein